MAPYTLYTGLSLGITFKAFLSLFLLHLLLVIVLKIHTSEIIKKAGRFEILRHCLENMNIPIPFEDFDVGKGCIKDYRRRRKNVIIEMSSLMTLNLIFNFLMMTPLIYTGQLRNKLEHIRSCSKFSVQDLTSSPGTSCYWRLSALFLRRIIPTTQPWF